MPTFEQVLGIAATFATVLLPFILTAIFNIKHKRH